MSSILKPWVEALGLRHQGVLLSAIRGCDTAPKDDPSKLLARCLRAEILNAHCGDAAKSRSFIEAVDVVELQRRMVAVLRSCDHYPQHYVAHLMHATEIIGHCGPIDVAPLWRWFYFELCYQLHVTAETTAELNRRLNADEETFARQQVAGGGR